MNNPFPNRLGTFMRCLIWIVLAAVMVKDGLSAPAEPGAPTEARPWQTGPLADPAFFPIAVWLQNPARAQEYRKAGINTYVGLWRGPTQEQLSLLAKADMKLICHQNPSAISDTNHSIIAWMHGDEPDNAQSLGQGKGYGPPILPEKIIADYQQMRRSDPSRPVLLNLGQGVAWDNWVGRGVRRNHPEDYPNYVKGGDIISFDIYPAVHDNPEVAGNLWYVGRGVERLVQWTRGEKLIWNCLECTRISNPNRKPAPDEVRAEAWMSLIHGSHGLIYFVHQFKPVFREAALLDDPEMLAAVTSINRQINELAPVLNSRTVAGVATVKPAETNVPIAFMVKQHLSSTYLFCVAMCGSATAAEFKLPGFEGDTSLEVLDENRSLPVRNGGFRDRFEPWGVHIYKVPMPGKGK